MKHKLLACGLSFLLLLAQNSFIFAQTVTAPRSTDELVALLNEPDAVVVVNIKKMLSDIAPTLLNRDAALLAKLAETMKFIEDDTGMNPYTLDKIVFGIQFDKASADPLLVIQSDSSARLAETVYQNELAKAKFENEVNPLKARIFEVSNRIMIADMGFGDGQADPANGDAADKLINDAKAVEAALDALTKTKMNQPLVDAALDDAKKIRIDLEAIQQDVKTSSTPNDYKERGEALEKQAKKINMRDTNRLAKIAELEKLVEPLDREATNFYYKVNELRNTYDERITAMINEATFEKAKMAVDTLPKSEAARTPVYNRLRKQFAVLQKNVTMLAADVKPENLIVPPANAPLKTDLSEESPVYPLSTVASRKEETVEGKKLSIITTVKKYGGGREDVVNINAMFQVDDKTLMSGSRDAVVAALGNKSADRSKTARELVAKSPDALVAFGVDLKAVDLKDFAEAFGEQKTAWQIFGALSSTGNDLTLEAIVEKTDRPLVLAAKPATEEKPKPNDLSMVKDNDAFTEMLDILAKSVVGIEGRFTLRFEKKKAVAMLAETPRLLRKMMAGKQTPLVKAK